MLGSIIITTPISVIPACLTCFCPSVQDNISRAWCQCHPFGSSRHEETQGGSRLGSKVDPGKKSKVNTTNTKKQSEPTNTTQNWSKKLRWFFKVVDSRFLIVFGSWSRWWFQFFLFSPLPGDIWLTHIFQLGGNSTTQLVFWWEMSECSLSSHMIRSFGQSFSNQFYINLMPQIGGLVVSLFSSTGVIKWDPFWGNQTIQI